VDLKEDSLTLILEYMDAGTLQDMVETGGVQSESVLANISLQVLRGLDFLHQKRIVHRDIKPANILVNHDGIVKLSDFGVARVMAAHEAAVKSNLGTFAFFSPERLHGDQYDFSSDIWSMGITLLTLALGAFPSGVGAYAYGAGVVRIPGE
jgi:serine/threonine protein kinase